MESERDKAIREAMAQPQSASNDAGSVASRPIRELIEADRYLASKDAASKPGHGLRFSKLVPPGAN